MRIVNEEVLDEFRTPGQCEVCGKWSERRVPHHIFCRGMGSANRLDHPFNLIALGGPFDCSCHEQAHKGELSRDELLAMASTREIRKIQRTPK